MTLFVLSAVLSAFAGIISSIRTSAANPNSGTGYELEVIAMVVIGGTALISTALDTRPFPCWAT